MQMPLTAFIIEMLKAEPDKVAKADPQKVAARYGINPDHAAAYLRLHRG